MIYLLFDPYRVEQKIDHFALEENDEIFVVTCQVASVLSILATAHEVAAIVASYLVQTC